MQFTPRSWFQRLQSRLLTYMAVATLLPLLVLGSVTYRLSVTGLTQQAQILTQELIEERASSIELFANNAEKLAYNIARTPVIAALLKQARTAEGISRIEKLKLQSTLEQGLSELVQTSDLLAIEIFTADQLFGVGDVSNENQFDRDQLARLTGACAGQSHNLCWPGLESNTYTDSNNGLVLPAIYPLREFDEALTDYRTIGYLVLKYSVSAFYDYTHSRHQEWMYHIIVDSKNRIVYHPSKSKIGQLLTLLTQTQQAAGPVTADAATPPREQNVHQVTATVSNMGWRVVGVIRQSKLERNAKLISQLTLGCIGFAILLMIMATIYIARRIIAPIRRITTASTRSEQLHPIDKIYSIQEINQLVCWFNDYTSIVNKERTQQKELQLAYDKLQMTQQQLIESEKMAALGNLVAGVAHEINTPLGVAITAASMVQERTAMQNKHLISGELTRSELDQYFSDSSQALTLALNNLHRAALLVQTFKQVAADQHQEHKQQLMLAKAIHEVLFSLAPQFKHFNIRTQVDCADDIEISSYPGVIWQVITNLMTNSYKHAFKPADQGTIHIAVHPAAETFELIYEDDGKGIAAEHLPKIFDPFFTTLRNEGGTGLGLNIVYNLVTQNLGGRIRCDSELGKGTKFTITLPYQAP